jgi:hypothetical protein
MTAVYALYSRRESAVRAVDNLRAAGIAADRIRVCSSEPLGDHELPVSGGETWMPWIAGLGGLAGMAVGYSLTATTQSLWPLTTGGMPVVSIWTNLIVIFELTMLGAVLSTVATLLVTAAIPRRRPKLYDSEIGNGKILVGVENPPDSEIVRHALRSDEDALLKTLT